MLPTAKRSLVLAALTALTLTAGASAQADVLWYNGDWDYQNGTLNQIGGGEDARIYDDFTVTSPTGWHITSVWSNDMFFGGFFGSPPTVSQAGWSIRSGVSLGNGGTVIASGTSPVQQFETGRSNFLYTEDTIQVSGLSLDLSPGTYWLQVTPLVAGDAYNSETPGDNAVGSPAGNDGNSFFSRPSDGSYFVDAGGDYSLGVGGEVIVAVPEPGMFAFLMGLGLSGALLALRRYRKSLRTGC